jgi:hypothetical protein
LSVFVLTDDLFAFPPGLVAVRFTFLAGAVRLSDFFLFSEELAVAPLRLFVVLLLAARVTRRFVFEVVLEVDSPVLDRLFFVVDFLRVAIVQHSTHDSPSRLPAPGVRY